MENLTLRSSRRTSIVSPYESTFIATDEMRASAVLAAGRHSLVGEITRRALPDANR